MANALLPRETWSGRLWDFALLEDEIVVIAKSQSGRATTCFEEAPPRSAAESSLAHRATVTAIRRLLDAMSVAIQEHPTPLPSDHGIGGRSMRT